MPDGRMWTKEEAKSWLRSEAFGDPRGQTTQLPAAQTLSQNELYIQKNARPGVKFDIETGLDAGTRAKLANLPTMEDKLYFLADKYDNRVRIASDKELIVTDIVDGKEVDYLVDERGVTKRDVMEFMVDTAPEMIGTAAGLRTGKSIPKVGELKGIIGGARNVIAGAAGSQTAAAIEDAIARSAIGRDVDPKEIAERRIKEFGAEAALSSILSVPASVFGRATRIAATPGKRPPVAKEAFEAAQRLEKLLGIPVELTLAQETGSPLIARLSAFLNNVDPGFNAVKKQKVSQNELMEEIQRYLTGPNVPRDIDIGNETLTALRSEAGRAMLAAKGARSALIQRDAQNVLDSISKLDIANVNWYRNDIGEALKSAAKAEKEAFQIRSKKLYDDYRALEGDQRLFETAGFKKKVDEVKKSLPPEEEIIENISDFVDANGRPIVDITKTTKPGKAFIPPSLKRFLDNYENLAENMNLSEMVQMRRMINNYKAQGDALPGLDTKQLGDLSHAITEEIENAVKRAPDPNMRKALEEANKFYREGRPRFTDRDVAKMFPEADQPGFVRGNEFVDKLVNGRGDSGQYVMLKKFYGEDSPAFKLVKRAFVDDLLERSFDGVSINLKQFEKAIGRLDKQIADDIFGTKFRRELAGANRLITALEDDAIPLEDLRNVMAGRVSPRELNNLIKGERRARELYKNSLIDIAKNGKESLDTIDPSRFTMKLLEDATVEEVDQIAKILEASHPATKQKLRARVLESVFQQAHGTPTPEEILRKIKGESNQIVGAEAVWNAIKDEKKQIKLKRILGDEKFDQFLDYLRIEAARSESDALGGMAGALAQGTILNKMITSIGTAMPKLIKYKMASHILTSDSLQSFIRTLQSRKGSPAVANMSQEAFNQLAVLSSPLLFSIVEDTPNENTLTRLLDSIKQDVFNANDARDLVAEKTDSVVGPVDGSKGSWLKWLREYNTQYSNQTQNSTSQ